MGSARVFSRTALALEMAIKTLDQRLASTSASRAQQRTIEQIVDVSVPPEVAKIIRVAPAPTVTQRDHTRTLATPAPMWKTWLLLPPMTDLPVIGGAHAIEDVAVSPTVTNDGPISVIGYTWRLHLV